MARRTPAARTRNPSSRQKVSTGRSLKMLYPRNCAACGIELEPDRLGAVFDDFCNQLINPKTEVRAGNWYDRYDEVKAVHRQLRGNRPGWGRTQPWRYVSW